jgi:hypothetical protein
MACIKIVLPFLTFSSSQAAVNILKPPYIIIIMAIKYKNHTRYAIHHFITTSIVSDDHEIRSSHCQNNAAPAAADTLAVFNPINTNHAVA